MEISAEKTKIMANNSTEGATNDITVSGQALETVSKFKYLGTVVANEGSRPEILSRIAQATEALENLKPIWEDKNIKLCTEVRLLQSLLIPIFLCACVAWTLTAELERKISAVDMRCCRRLLGISYREHITNNEVRISVIQAIGPHMDLLTLVKEGTRNSGLAKTTTRHSGGWAKARQVKEEMGM